MDDLDLLVPASRLTAALGCLQGMGYAVSHQEQFPGAYLIVTHHVGLARAEPYRCVVELHHDWLALPADLSARVSMDAILERALPVEIGGAQACIPETHDQLLHLAAHLASQASVTGRLIWCCDLDRLMRRSGAELDWDGVLGRAQEYRMVLALQRVLPVLAAKLATPVPAGILERLARLRPVPAERRQYGRVAANQFTRLADGWRRLAGLSSPAARLEFFWRMVFPSRSYMRATYGAANDLRLARQYVGRWGSVAAEYFAAGSRRPRG
jgi:hypothetical protein